MTAIGREQITIGSAPDMRRRAARPRRRAAARAHRQARTGSSSSSTSARRRASRTARRSRRSSRCRSISARRSRSGRSRCRSRIRRSCAMLMSHGQLPARRAGTSSSGATPARASLVITHAAVSGQHATVMLDRMMVVDHGSTSGTYVARSARSRRTSRRRSIRTASSRSVPSRCRSSLLAQIAQRAARRRRAAGAAGWSPLAHGAWPPQHAPRAAPASAASRRRATRRASTAPSSASSRSTQLQSSVITIGRTPDNKSSSRTRRSARSTRRSSSKATQLFLEDLRQRERHVRARPAPRAGPARPGRRTARRSSSARCRCSIHIAESSRSTSSSKTQAELGGQAALRDRSVGPLPRGARSRRQRRR